MKTQPVLEVKKLRKVIGRKPIIHDLNLSVYPGEVFGFLGPNGAGKTTTIRMIVGLISMSAGQVIIQGSDLKQDFESALSHVGGIVENPELYPFLTGYKNLLHFWRMCNGVKKERIDEVVRLVGLEKRIHDKVKTYSLGMRQRLGLAQALLHSPSLLILDEPTNGLDPAGIREIRQYLRSIAHEEQMAILVSSHLLSEMEMMCDRIGILQAGKLIDIKEVAQWKEQQLTTLILQVDAPSNVYAYISHTFPEYKTAISGDQLTLLLEREHIPSLLQTLTVEGFQILDIQMGQRTLEDTFLEITGGKQIG
ncbi:ABC transporter ATP-binding protein [Mechercharimyces sp. CAU 1602]|uniref:ABC transporter ATP-binding protein n=1 Tax=Mechercharimyces sp. CAU 1602 TaxID=2973933 RepID=UPI0021630230|nr:ABC transporter ATP-binding protein [Mechercharimyces sp. CAU 1602]MCS1352540.1 ABC transporter ATP-binding protein [Mechercharimyces sp. CAU 1602]